MTKPKIAYSTGRAHSRRVEVVGPRLTQAPPPAEQKILKCPGCGRATVRRHRLYLGKEYIRTADKPKGVVYCVREDGTCDKCWRTERAKAGIVSMAKRKRATDKYYHEMTDAEIERAQDGLRDYWIQRRLRGIPPEGIRFPGDPK